MGDAVKNTSYNKGKPTSYRLCENVFIKVSTITSELVPSQLPWETLWKQIKVGVPLTYYTYHTGNNTAKINIL